MPKTRANKLARFFFLNWHGERKIGKQLRQENVWQENIRPTSSCPISSCQKIAVRISSGFAPQKFAPLSQKIPTKMHGHLTQAAPNCWEQWVRGETGVKQAGFDQKRAERVKQETESEFFAPHPPAPSPREFGERWIRIERGRVRIHEERGSKSPFEKYRSCVSRVPN